MGFPSYVTSQAKDLLCKLLDKNPARRLGSGPEHGEEIKRNAFFAGVNWDALLNLQETPPFKPDVSGPDDTKYFDKEFTSMPAVNSEVRGGQDVKHFEGFTYSGK